jgi:hypothetical protein
MIRTHLNVINIQSPATAHFSAIKKEYRCRKKSRRKKGDKQTMAIVNNITDHLTSWSISQRAVLHPEPIMFIEYDSYFYK